MRKRPAPPVVSSMPVRRKSRAAAGAAQSATRRSGVVVVPVAHTSTRRVVRLRISAVKVSKQSKGLG
jgi:hypothetical protein